MSFTGGFRCNFSIQRLLRLFDFGSASSSITRYALCFTSSKSFARLLCIQLPLLRIFLARFFSSRLGRIFIRLVFAL